MSRVYDALGGIGGLGDGSAYAWICSPFVTERGLEWFESRVGLGAPDDSGLLSGSRLLTCLSASAAASGSLSLSCIRDLRARGVEVRHLENLHAKIIIKGDRVLFGSANLTLGGVKSNREIVCEPNHSALSDRVQRLFSRYWERAQSTDDEQLDRCAHEAECAELKLSDHGAVTARWNEQYALVSYSIEVLPSLGTLELPAEVLGYSSTDEASVKRAVRIRLRDTGKSISNQVRAACDDQIREMKAHFVDRFSDQPVLELAIWKEFEQSRRKALAAVRRELEKCLTDQYERLKRTTRDRAVEAVIAFQKDERIDVEELAPRVARWFERTFPSSGQLVERAQIRCSYQGLSPIRMQVEPAFRGEVLEFLGRPRQSRLF